MALRMHDELPGWEHACIEEEFELTPCEEFAPITTSAGLSAVDGNVLTSAHVLGNPAHKRILREKFHATIVDMETAALARIARSEGIPLGCVRAVSDEAGDTFLTPFSYDPSAGIPTRAKQLMDAGMMDTYREWKVHSAAAKACLFRFLSAYLIRD
jgi:hypothetical protein